MFVITGNMTKLLPVSHLTPCSVVDRQLPTEVQLRLRLEVHELVRSMVKSGGVLNGSDAAVAMYLLWVVPAVSVTSLDLFTE